MKTLSQTKHIEALLLAVQIYGSNESFAMPFEGGQKELPRIFYTETEGSKDSSSNLKAILIEIQQRKRR